LDKRISTALIAVRDTLVALLLSLPLASLVLAVMLFRLAEPYPGVSVFTPLTAWSVSGASVDDPAALAVLRVARDAPAFEGAPLWLHDSGNGVLLVTPRKPGLQAMAREALGSTPVDTSRVIHYRGAYTAASEAAAAEYRRDPVAYFNGLRWALPVLLGSSSVGFLIAGWWFRRRRPVEDWEATGPRKLSWFRAIRKGVAVGFGALLASIVVGITTVILFGLEDIGQPDLEALGRTEGLALLSLVVFTTIIAPLSEELFFRGHLFRWSASRCGVLYAYVLTGVLFALLHGHLPGVPSYLAMAVVFGWSYERWRTLVVPITAHATVNCVAIAALVLR